jgi:hypothetical protein
MNILALVTQSILSPALLFFLFGVFIGVLKTDLKIPESISKFLSLYLIIAIGFKGGVALASTGQFTLQITALLFIGIVLSFVLPFFAYFFLRKTTKLDQANAAAIAAHYGSVSIVTFITAGSFLKTEGLTYPGYMVAILATMEAPAILSGIYLAQADNKKHSYLKLFEAFKSNGCLLLLFCSFIIGWLTGEPGFTKVKGFFEAPFQGILCLFLLDMGLLVAAQVQYLRAFTWNLIAFGLYMPLFGATLGLITSYMLGLDIGTGTMFMVLCASASYIAVPAAMRLAISEAKAAIYLPMALAITFPFNIVLGIPLYYSVARLCLG